MKSPYPGCKRLVSEFGTVDLFRSRVRTDTFIHHLSHVITCNVAFTHLSVVLVEPCGVDPDSEMRLAFCSSPRIRNLQGGQATEGVTEDCSSASCGLLLMTSSAKSWRVSAKKNLFTVVSGREKNGGSSEESLHSTRPSPQGHDASKVHGGNGF